MRISVFHNISQKALCFKPWFYRGCDAWPARFLTIRLPSSQNIADRPIAISNVLYTLYASYLQPTRCCGDFSIQTNWQYTTFLAYLSLGQPRGLGLQLCVASPNVVAVSDVSRPLVIGTAPIVHQNNDVGIAMSVWGSTSTWLDSTRLDTFDVSSPCILAVSS